MQKKFRLVGSYSISACCVILLPFVGGLSDEVFSKSSNDHKNIKENLHKLSPQLTSNIAVHGLLLWASMGLLMPVGILTIRMSSVREAISGRETRVFFYLHVFLQLLSVILATIGAVMSIKNFENSFNNNHQRLGLALYAAMWMQASIGFFKPPRGGKRRTTWYFVHWLLGTAISLVGIINIYTGLRAYHNKTSRSTTLWTILFTVFEAFPYITTTDMHQKVDHE
ncbi:Cytochrome b561 and DOMON domain-containing protein [Melia azedarach]|uniref:Cytochrome b561 and DOMON domain-containing protein n=1 Tax=Melia azedarach TaxID=155640 RepID=A0ACC1WY44_MELAZ|nr:Cytochrome b561 and DOMON domain-containing protein [Melia azedarach]